METLSVSDEFWKKIPIMYRDRCKILSYKNGVLEIEPLDAKVYNKIVDIIVEEELL